MPLVIRPEAEVDITEAFEWYESHRRGLGSRFLEELERGLAVIEQQAVRFPAVYREVRRALLRHFPYAIFFVTHGDKIDVIAVMHAAREPVRWISRS